MEDQSPESQGSPESPGRRETWIRLLFVILFAFIYTVGEIVLAALVVLQFGFKLITGECNDYLQQFSKGLTLFIYQILQYVTFNSDDQPFPFNDWPNPDTDALPAGEPNP